MPSFAILYWVQKNDRQQVIWEGAHVPLFMTTCHVHHELIFCMKSGPEHMKAFAEDEEVISKFCGIALSRAVLSKPPQPAEGLYL